VRSLLLALLGLFAQADRPGALARLTLRGSIAPSATVMIDAESVGHDAQAVAARYEETGGGPSWRGAWLVYEPNHVTATDDGAEFERPALAWRLPIDELPDAIEVARAWAPHARELLAGESVAARGGP
jgi:hypothetical protein